MKRAMTLLAVVAVVGFVAGQALSEEAKPVGGTVVKVDAEKKVVVLKVKQEGAEAKEVSVAYDEKTQVSVDKKEAKIEDVKAGMHAYAKMSEDGKVAVKIMAMTPKPKKAE